MVNSWSMIFIHLIHGQDAKEEDSDFFIDSLLEDELNEGDSAFIAISGSLDYFKNTKDRLCVMQCLTFCFLGQNPLINEDVIFISSLVAFINKLDGLTFFRVENEDIYSDYFDFKEINKGDFVELCFKLFSLLREDESSKKLSAIDSIIKNIKNVSKGISNSTLSSLFNSILSFYRNIIDVERKFIYGNELRDGRTISIADQESEVKSYEIEGVFDDYKMLKSVSHSKAMVSLTSKIDKKIDYLSYRSQFSQESKSNGSSKSYIKMLFWHASYFLVISRHHKDNGSYSSGMIYLIRALENSIQAAFFHYGGGGFSRNGDFHVSGRKLGGAGSLWHSFEDKHLSESEKIKFGIKSVIALRNISSGGHGYSHLNENIFNESYVEVLKFIRFIDYKVFPGKKFWAGITELSNVNLLKNVGDSIVEAFIDKAFLK